MPGGQPTTAQPSGAAEVRRARHTAVLLGCVFPLLAGLALYGWCAVATVCLTVVCTLPAVRIWRQVGLRGGLLRVRDALLPAVLLAMMLPGDLPVAGGSQASALGRLAAIPAAALLLAMLMWLGAGAAHVRLHPVLCAWLVVAALGGRELQPHAVLHRLRALTGDLGRQMSSSAVPSGEDPWIRWRWRPAADAVRYEETAARRLGMYTSPWRSTPPPWHSVEALLRDAMPPMEDLVVGGHPGPLGASSAIAVLVGGLFMLYRRATDLRVPLVGIGAAFLGFLVLPVPVLTGAEQTQWRPLFLPRAHIDLATMLTFVNYQMLASPLLLAAFYLAPLSGIAPRRPAARTVYAVLFGLGAAACQMYLWCEGGPYAALFLATQLVPWLDRALPARRRNISTAPGPAEVCPPV